MMKVSGLKVVWGLLIVILMTGCPNGETPDVDDVYIEQIEQWRQERLERLTAPNGWLSLAGLYWLEEGENTFGSHSNNDFVLDKPDIPDRIGTFILDKNRVSFRVSPGVEVTLQSRAVSEISLESDAGGKPTILKMGSLSWFVIARGEKTGVRLKDSQHPRIQKLKKIRAFPIDKKWRIQALLQKYEKPKILKIPTVLGTIEEQASPGVLKFTIDGISYRLYPGGSDGDLFAIFGDLTNARETYGGGRFLIIPKPDENGKTWIDFNKAYNPPCAFSPYATCPLPPEENQLAIRILAGELMVEGFDH